MNSGRRRTRRKTQEGIGRTDRSEGCRSQQQQSGMRTEVEREVKSILPGGSAGAMAKNWDCRPNR